MHFRPLCDSRKPIRSRSLDALIAAGPGECTWSPDGTCIAFTRESSDGIAVFTVYEIRRSF